ncbi:hypothetical protein F4679DRAFT_183468 [Xylaria curta]|nr:hypothetical protein F4679DRAFT_183468 [Xylaria curta]
MGYVLADQQGWLSPSSVPYSDFVVLQNFANLRNAVNAGTADFFMWEHFTSKRYYDSGEIRRIGEIYTPWSSWKIVASTALVNAGEKGKPYPKLTEVFEKLDQGVQYFETHKDEAVEYISTQLDYSAEDAREWLKTVRFSSKTEGVNIEVIIKCICILQKAGVLKGGDGVAAEVKAEGMLVNGLAAQFPE